jgi:subtilisin family serine protease
MHWSEAVMLIAVLWVILGNGVSAPPSLRAVHDRFLVRTVDGETIKEPIDPAVSVVQSIGPDGKVVETTWGGERRVLIELRARPILDRKSPGTAAETSRQQEQLARNLAALDLRLGSRKPARITRRFQHLFSGVAATVDAETVDEIRRLPDVVAVHEDGTVQAQLAESVPLIGATAVRSTYGVTGAGVKVAVIDTGVDYTHPDLGGCFGSGCRVVGGYDFVNDDADPWDDQGHGTHVAGIIAAHGTVDGVAPGATILAYKVLSSAGYGTYGDIIAAIERAVADGAKVANLSLGGSGNPNDPMSRAVDNATAAGMLSVIAAGNSGPGYRTVASPGVARTALTVGAIDKTETIASFSSRGPAADGDQYLLKPEVVSQGVSILSTVPASGRAGNSTRYAAYSGTSMATPHVAGAAALLLQWNPAQSPADVKNRLAGSARSGSGDRFIEGAGAIDLVPAFASTILASTSGVSFGLAAGTSGIVSLEQTLSIRNTAAGAATVSLSVGSPALPPGTTMEIIPASVTLQSMQTAVITLRLRVDTAITPEAPDPLAYSSSLRIETGARTTNVPVCFVRASVLTLAFDEIPWVVYLVNPALDLAHYIFDPRALSFSTVVPAGKWDVFVDFTNTSEVRPITLVTREQQNVQGRTSLSIKRAEAIRAVTVRALDDQGQPLPDSQTQNTTMIMGLRDPSDPSRISFVRMFWTSGLADFRLSPLSSRYLVGIIGSAAVAETSKYFIYSSTGEGLPADVVLPRAGVPMRRLVQAVPPLPAKAEFANGYAMNLKERPFELYTEVAVGAANPNWTLHFQATSPPSGLPLVAVHRTGSSTVDPLTRNVTARIYGPFMHYEGGDDIVVDRLPFFDMLDPSRAPDAVLGAAVQRWDLEAAPHVLPLQFRNSPGSIFVTSRDGLPDTLNPQAEGWYVRPGWLTNTYGFIQTVAGADPQFSVHDGAGAFRYSLPQWVLRFPFNTQPEAQQLRFASTYAIGGVPGSSRAITSFDTSKADPNPPYVASLRIEQNGLRTATPFQPSTSSNTKVAFRATDDTSLASVALEWRESGATEWTLLPVTAAGAEHTVPFELEGRIDLRLTASDASGNSFQQEWTPAVITTGAAPPSRPASVQANREGPASIRVAWAPSSSPSGLREYRVERLPGGQVFVVPPASTTFLDASDLVAGATYLYRVSAVGTEGVRSAPSPYDAATLVALQDDPIVAGVTPIRGAHVGELRIAIDALRKAAGLQPAWTTYAPPTGFVTPSEFLTMRERINEARAAVQLPPVQFTITPTRGAPIRASQLQELRNGVQ